METAIEKAARLAGSKSALAKGLGVSPQAVQNWVDDGQPPVRRCKDIEIFLGGRVTRSELRPDHFYELSQESP